MEIDIDITIDFKKELKKLKKPKTLAIFLVTVGLAISIPVLVSVYLFSDLESLGNFKSTFSYKEIPIEILSTSLFVRDECSNGVGIIGDHIPNEDLCRKNLPFYFTKGIELLSIDHGNENIKDVTTNLILLAPTSDFCIKVLNGELESNNGACDVKSGKIVEKYPIPIFGNGIPIVVSNDVIVNFDGRVSSEDVSYADILFSDLEFDVYEKSLKNSIELSIAQSLYEFGSKNDGLWYNYGVVNVPEISGIEEDVEDYSQRFMRTHEKFNFDNLEEDESRIVFPLEIGDGSLSIGERSVGIIFDNIHLRRDADARIFVPEAELDTVFGKMYFAADEFVNGHEIASTTVDGIGIGKEKSLCGADSFIDTFINVNATKLSQTESRGWMDYCDLNTVYYAGCAETNPCEGFGPLIEEPTFGEVFRSTHRMGLGNASGRIENYTKDHFTCLERTLDSQSNDYSVVFDNVDVDVGIQAVSCETNPSRPVECGGYAHDFCLLNSTTNEPIKWDWYCYEYKRKSCDFDYSVVVEASVRFQEDGFFYKFFDDDGTGTEDNIKLEFGIISGNKRPE